METKTIEERVIQFLDYRFIPHTLQGLTVKELCIQIATEQREIDIQRAVEILKATGYFQDDEFGEEVMIDQFIKAMKGE